MEDVQGAVFSALTELQDLEGRVIWDPISTESKIFGPEAPLDSMSFVSLMAIVEEKVLDATGVAITVASDKAFSLKYNPFKNAKSLVQFIIEEIGEAKS